MNKAILLGNLGADPELKYTNAGQAVLKLRLATSEKWVGKDGTKQERTEWHTVIVWGKRAEGLNKILSKGNRIAVEGRITYRSWEDQQGVKRYATDIIASEVHLAGGGGQRDDQGDAERRSGGSYDRPSGGGQRGGSKPSGSENVDRFMGTPETDHHYGGDGFSDDDIPF